METRQIMKQNTETTSKSMENETRNNNKDETRTIAMKKKIILDANYKILGMDRKYNKDTLMAIQNTFTKTGES